MAFIRKNKQTHGLVLAELIMVLVLITVLISLLTPSLALVRYQGRHNLCSNNMRQVAFGFLDFANAHKQRLPGNCFIPNLNAASPSFTPIDQRSWLYQSQTNDYTTAPVSGSMFDFLRSKTLYRCPILQTGVIGSGVGSNGLFDYGMYNSFYGARVDMIRLTTRFFWRISRNPNPNYNSLSNMDMTRWDERVTPIVVEEDPYYNMNRNNIEADHSNYDVMGNWHQPNPTPSIGAHANYAALDGSVQFFERTGDYQVAFYAWSVTSSGKIRQIGAIGPAPYALWDSGIDHWPPSPNAPVPTW